jgi:hypothetical protein
LGACGGAWGAAARDVLALQGASPLFEKTVYSTLVDGRGKENNLWIFGAKDCAKTFVLRPLEQIYDHLTNAAAGQFALTDIHGKHVVIFHDFRWSESKNVLPWGDFLAWLEGGELRVPQPKSFKPSDTRYTEDAPIYFTSSGPLIRIPGGQVLERETEMAAVRLKYMHFPHTIARPDRKITRCATCFAQLVIGNGRPSG